MDETEDIRRGMVKDINSQVETSNEQLERQRLEAQYGQVWDTDQLRNDFEVTGFMAPFCIVRRKADNMKGVMMFQHSPRFYFEFSHDSK